MRDGASDMIRGHDFGDHYAPAKHFHFLPAFDPLEHIGQVMLHATNVYRFHVKHYDAQSSIRQQGITCFTDIMFVKHVHTARRITEVIGYRFLVIRGRRGRR